MKFNIYQYYSSAMKFNIYQYYSSAVLHLQTLLKIELYCIV